jgi:diketogulonate reductase-like aldo/keto reductase
MRASFCTMRLLLLLLSLSPRSSSALAAIPTLVLSHVPGGASVTIPRVLLGTGGGGGGYDVRAWLTLGGPGFDTAQTYCYSSAAPFCSQVAIANALAAAPPSSPPFLVSKIEPEDFGDEAALNGFGRAVSRGILQEMSLARLDLLMFHQAGRAADASNTRPPCFNSSAVADGRGAYADCRIATFRAMQALVGAGVARAIAVSNWQQRDLQQVHDATGAWPSALEVEVHPLWHEDALLDFCAARNITIINYAPLAVSPAHGLLQLPELLAAAAAHGVTPAQAALRWGLQRTGGVVIPRSANASHMRDNLDPALFTFALSEGEMAAIGNQPQKKIFSVYCQPWC